MLMMSGYYVKRDVIAIAHIQDLIKTETLEENCQIPYDEVCFNGIMIKLPNHNSFYSVPFAMDFIYDLFSNVETDEIQYYDPAFHKDMKMISQMNPSLIFGINVIVDEYGKYSNEYYFNGKIIDDLTCKYDELVLEENPSQIIQSNDWQDIMTQ